MPPSKKTTRSTTTLSGVGVQRVLSPFLDLDHNYNKTVIYSRFSESHPFYREINRWEREEYECRRMFQPTRVRHQFVFVCFGIQAAVVALPLVSMSVFLREAEVRALLGGEYNLDKIFFLVGLLLFGGMHVRNRFRHNPVLAAVLYAAFLAVQTLQLGWLYYHGDYFLYQTVLLCLMQVGVRTVLP